MKNKYVPFVLVDKFFKENKNKYNVEQLFIKANEYFIENNLVQESIDPFQERIDIILCDDQKFIEISNLFPIDLADDFTSPYSNLNIFPYQYECFFLRSLNGLPQVMHSSPFFEVCYVWSGKCTQCILKEEIELSEGDFLIIPPGQEHSIKVEEETSIIFNILIRRNIFENTLFSLLTKNTILSTFFRNSLFEKETATHLLIHTDNSFVLKRIIKHLAFMCYKKQSFFCDFIVGILQQLFAYIVERGEAEIYASETTSNLSFIYILQYISQNFRTVTLGILAEKFHFNEAHLSRLIKKTTGQTFSEILRNARIDRAKLLLSRTDYDVNKISSLVGYQDSGSFTKIFKKETGVTPSQFRNESSDSS